MAKYLEKLSAMKSWKAKCMVLDPETFGKLVGKAGAFMCSRSSLTLVD